MSSDQGPTGKHGRSLSELWFHPALPYGVGYSLAVAVNSTLLVLLLADQFGLRQKHFFNPPHFCCFSTFVPFIVCLAFPPIRRRLEHAVEVGAFGAWPSFSFLAVGLVAGSAPSLIAAAVAVIPDAGWRLLLLCLVELLGPLLGLAWLVRHRPKLFDPDYDDLMVHEQSERARSLTIELATPLATQELGHRLGPMLFPNALIALVGPLGAGKTHLSRAIAEGLGIANAAAVTSPTFTLIHEYPARLPIYHFDAYRLTGPDAFLDLGVTEYYEAGGVCLIEWADRVEAALPTERLTIRLEPIDANSRRAIVQASGERYVELLRDLVSPETASSLP
jgi:tRNA threonylcarbamoyladenosine biosynthesis protein TsaE